MFSVLKAAAALVVGGLLAPAAYAQAPTPLPTHAVRSINPTDTDFRDLAFLKAEIGPARVVMLGEPSHGEGNVFEAKIRLLRYLREQMGFTTVAFESGFYDLHKAQQALEAGRPAQEAIGNSVFATWTGTQEFQAILPLLGKDGMRVAGFDPQLTGEYGSDTVDDLEAFLASDKGAALLNYEYLEQVIDFMGEQFSFVPTTTLPEFEKEMAKATKLVNKAAASTDAKRRTEAAFWQQCLRSLLAQARNYAGNDPDGKTETEFKARDSNPRDAGMADNLLWYLKQHPQEKVVCWAALPHLANKAEVLENAEMKEYRPMGRAVKAALGPDQVYILGTLSGGGTHQFSTLPLRSVPAPAAGTLEAELLAQPADYAFVSLKHDAPGRRLTTYAFDYTPLTGPWSEVVDGFLFLRAVNPPHFDSSMGVALVAGTDSAAARTAPSALNPATRPLRVRTGVANAAAATVRGVVLDTKTGRPVPYASVAVPGQGVGTVADGEGRFVLPGAGLGTVQVSSVGYATASVKPNAGGTPLPVRLVPAAYKLQGVQVRGESLDPRKIMKKVLAALPKNYEQGEYMAEAYAHRRLINFDTLRYEAEYVSQVFEPAGHRDFSGGFLGLGPPQQHRLREAQILQPSPTPPRFSELMQGGEGFLAETADPVRISPLFKTRTLGKFKVHLDTVLEHGATAEYVISFAVKRANHRSTGTYLTSGYSGRIHVQQADYAVTRYEALWQSDTVTENAVARQHYGRHDRIAALYRDLFTDARTDHVAEYRLGANRHYHLHHSVAKGISAGRKLGGRAFYRQSLYEVYLSPLPVTTSLPAVNPALDPRVANDEIYQLFKASPMRPEFWQTYQRPVE